MSRNVDAPASAVKSISVIERDQLDKVGKEIRLGQSGLVDAGTAAELGRIAHAKGRALRDRRAQD